MRGVRGWAAIGLLAAALPGCPGTPESEEDFNVVTSITVDPAAFPRDVPCSDAPGAIRSYVATLFDQTEEAWFQLPSALPAPCSQRVSFRFIVPGHLYRADIDAYDQFAGELEPVEGDGSGSRHMLGPDGAPVSPRWTTTCGLPDEGSFPAQAQALESTNVVLRACNALDDSGTPGETAIVVDAAAALGAIGCDQIVAEELVVRSEDGLASQLPGCPPLPVQYTGVTAGAGYAFRIEARAPEASPGTVTYSARCFVVAEAGIAVHATCDALTDRGALVIPSAAFFGGSGLACAGGDPTYVAALATVPAVQSAPTPCDEDVRFTQLTPGTYNATVTLGGNPVGECLGTTVLPGETTVAECAAAAP